MSILILKIATRGRAIRSDLTNRTNSGVQLCQSRCDFNTNQAVLKKNKNNKKENNEKTHLFQRVSTDNTVSGFRQSRALVNQLCNSLMTLVILYI